MERRQFTREFKLEAVRLTKQRGVSYARVAGNNVDEVDHWLAPACRDH